MSPIDTFWTTYGTGGTNLIEATPGDAFPEPYLFLPGSTGVDFTNPQIWIDAGLVFPEPSPFPDRPNFATATVADFMGWHSQHQVEYILERGKIGYSPDPGPPVPAILPADTLTVHYVAFADGPTLVLGQDLRTIYNIQTLRLTDIATMPAVDQKALAVKMRDPVPAPNGTVVDLFEAQSELLMLRPRDGETVASVRDAMNKLVTDVEDLIAAPDKYDVADRQTFLEGFLFNPEVRVKYFRHFFVEELGLYARRLERMVLFNESAVKDFLEDLVKRFDRIESYYSVSLEDDTRQGLRGGVNAVDGGAALASGLGIFTEMESQLFQIALARAYVSETGTLIEPVKGRLMSTQEIIDKAKGYADFGSFLTAQSADIYGRVTAKLSDQKRMDAPDLIFVLQTFDNYEAEAEAQIKSQELQQQSTLLQDYSKMQELVNGTLKKFKVPEIPKDSTKPPPQEKLGLLGLDSVSDFAAQTDVQAQLGDILKIVSMFDTAAVVNGLKSKDPPVLGPNSFHPVEMEKSDNNPKDFRPTLDIASGDSLIKHEKSVWDGLAVRLGDATKIISQSSQIAMDAINKLSQQKNRHYELGSNVLNKMTDLLREITS